MCLDGKAEFRWRLRQPVLQGRLFHQLSKSEVHFDGIQVGGVEIQKFLLRELLWIEIRLPAWIRPPRSAREQLRHGVNRKREMILMANDLSTTPLLKRSNKSSTS